MEQGFLPFSSRLFLSADEIFDQINQGNVNEFFEDRRLERKPSNIHPRELSEYFSMWANTLPDGGLIVVGVSDDGSVTGLSSLSQQRINALEKTGIDFCPDAKYRRKLIPIVVSDRTETGDCLLIFRIHYSDDKVAKCTSGNAYVRIGDSKRKLTSPEIRAMEVNKGQVDFEREQANLNYPDDFDTDLIGQFTAGVVSKKRLEGNHTTEEILEQRHLGKRVGGKFIPNNACALLFARDPMTIFPGCKIRFLRFDGEQERTGDKFNAVRDEWVEGAVPRLVVEMEKVLDSQLRVFSRMGPDGKFYTAPEYPKEAWYEAVINACVHRSYVLRNMSLAVKMFDDRLVIESPGGFPPFVTPENIYDAHHPTNPHVMDAMYYLDFVKAANEGTRRIRDTMVGMSLPKPEFQQKQFDVAMVRVTLHNNIKQRRVWVDREASEIIGATIMRGLSENQKRAINFVAEHGSIGVSQLQRLTGMSWPTCKRMLEELSEKGILEHKVRPELDRDPNARYFLRR